MGELVKPQIEIEGSITNLKLSTSYVNLTDRLKSFASCHVPTVSKDDLAALGLYYVKKDVLIKCVYCDSKFVDFSKDLLSHSCSERNKLDQKSECTSGNDHIVSDINQGKDVCKIEKNAREIWLDKMGIRGNVAPKLPRYSNLKDRLKSFESWKCVNQEPNLLSEAGFYYIGIEDRTACFHCGGGLREWKKTDDPWIEHAYWFGSKCHFVLNTKGKDFIDNAWRRKMEIVKEKEVENNADDLKDIIGIIDSKHSKKEKSQNCKVNSVSKMETNVLSNEKESLTICRICFSNERNVMFFPCHHIVSCDSCAVLLKRCVICRASIKNITRVYHS